MKDYITQMIREIPPLKARNVLREYLQARILHAMQKAGAFTCLAFHGGTCLRFLYSIPRYSEDLGFSLEKRDRGYHFDGILKAIRRELAPEGYVFDFKVAERYSVHSAFVRFRGLLYELELSPNHDEVISVKVEIDTNPPTGVGLETTIIRRHVTLNIQHHDKASLLAGKLHALLQRRYTKGDSPILSIKISMNGTGRVHLILSTDSCRLWKPDSDFQSLTRILWHSINNFDSASIPFHDVFGQV